MRMRAGVLQSSWKHFAIILIYENWDNQSFCCLQFQIICILKNQCRLSIYLISYFAISTFLNLWSLGRSAVLHRVTMSFTKKKSRSQSFWNIQTFSSVQVRSSSHKILENFFSQRRDEICNSYRTCNNSQILFSFSNSFRQSV